MYIICNDPGLRGLTGPQRAPVKGLRVTFQGREVPFFGGLM